MKHTVGYDASVLLPITYSFKCSKCGNSNTETSYIAGSAFGFTKQKARDNANDSLNVEIEEILNDPEWYTKCSYPLTSICANCGKSQKWSKMKFGLGFLWIPLLIIAGILTFLFYKDWDIATTYFPFLTSQFPTFWDFIAIEVLVLLVLFLGYVIVRALSSRSRGKKFRKRIEDDTLKPILISIGDVPIRNSNAYIPRH